MVVDIVTCGAWKSGFRGSWNLSSILVGLNGQKKKQKPAQIFVGSSGDMWGSWVPGLWILAVLNRCAGSSRHTYQFLTKNPDRYGDFPPLDNAWYGTTVDGTEKTKGNISKLIFWDRESGIKNHFVSFEPLLKPVDPDLLGIQWVIIGADSTRGAISPPKEWADTIIGKARARGIPVFVKDNYGYPESIKETPGTGSGTETN